MNCEGKNRLRWFRYAAEDAKAAQAELDALYERWEQLSEEAEG